MMSLRRSVAQTCLRSSVRPMVAKRASQLLFAAYRPVATQSTTPEQAQEILIKQRINRPMSPHLAIYQPQLTWYLSGFHRIGGCVVAGTFYVFLLGYVAAPYVGLPFDSNSIAATFGALPLLLKIPIKFFASFPVIFHVFNGCRHLLWDTTYQLSLKGVYRTGYIVVGIATIGSLVASFL